MLRLLLRLLSPRFCRACFPCHSAFDEGRLRRYDFCRDRKDELRESPFPEPKTSTVRQFILFAPIRGMNVPSPDSSRSDFSQLPLAHGSSPRTCNGSVAFGTHRDLTRVIGTKLRFRCARLSFIDRSLFLRDLCAFA